MVAILKARGIATGSLLLETLKLYLFNAFKRLSN